jgi:hypothetical protein
MRYLKGLVIGVSAAGLVGCTGVGSQPSLTVGAPAAPAASAAVVTATAKAAEPVSLQMKTGARQAAEQFYSLYSARQFTALWGRSLSGHRRRKIPDHQGRDGLRQRGHHHRGGRGSHVHSRNDRRRI